MEKTYTLNDVAMMSGFTTRTLRNYLNQGLLEGQKTEGIWRFTAEAVDRFFRQPFVQEGLRIKHSAQVFDFMAERRKTKARSCVILDVPCTVTKGNQISAFFCEKMQDAEDAQFQFNWNNGLCRVILSGAAATVLEILRAYEEAGF